jgi:type II secretory ATPase GspE/PulE/Tfp pilus assembly ATPase PilB-like protein
LISLGKVSESDLEAALAYRAVRGVKLGQALTMMGLLTERDLADALRRQGRVHSIQLTPHLVDRAVAAELGRESARSLLALPINRIAGVTTVAMEDPADSYSVDAISVRLGTPVLAVHAEPARIRECIEHVFDSESDHSVPSTTRTAIQDRIDEALELGAHCILFELHGDGWRVRARIGAEMRELGATGLDDALTQLAALDGTDIEHGGVHFELAVTTLATLRGPSAAVHIQRCASAASDELLEGLDPSQRAVFEHIVANQQGLIVVTGSRAHERANMLRAMSARMQTQTAVSFTFDVPCLHEVSGATHVVTGDDTRAQRRETLARVLAHEPDTLVIGNVDDRMLLRQAVRAAVGGARIVIELEAPNCAAALALLRALDVDPCLLRSVLRGVIAPNKVVVRPSEVDAQ